MTFSSQNNLSGFPQPFTRVFPAPISSARAPTGTDYQYPIGQQWIDTVGEDAYILVNVTANTAQWNVSAITPGNVDTLTGNSGGAVTPSTGNINILGTGALAFAGASPTLTGSITPSTYLVATLAGNSGGALSPTAGAMSIVGTGEVTVSGSGSTLTIAVTPSTTTVSTLTGNSGGALSPTAGNINILGSGTLAFTGAGSTLTGAITPGTGLVSTITGGSGGALSPTSGNINVLGTANQITSVGSGSTVTLALASGLIAPSSITATTSITATLGAITATNGDIVATNGNFTFGTAGNKVLYSSVATVKAAGANSAGSVVLETGSVIVSTSAVTTNSLIKIWRQSVGATGAAALGQLSVGTISNGVSFVINAWSAADATSLQASDVSVVGWEIIN